MQNGSAAMQESKAEREDSKAATAEAEMSQTAGDVGDWLGIDSGAPAPVQVTLVPGQACPAQPRGCRCLGSQPHY